MKKILTVIEAACWISTIVLGVWMFVEIMRVNTNASMMTLWYGILATMVGASVCHGIRRG